MCERERENERIRKIGKRERMGEIWIVCVSEKERENAREIEIKRECLCEREIERKRE